MLRRLLLAAALLLAGGATPALADPTDRPWPPLEGDGALFVHFGEEHWNDDDGLRILPRAVAMAAAFKPTLVTMSGDKANDGVVPELAKWEELMTPLDRAGVPYLAAVGNHDRLSTPGSPEKGANGLFYVQSPDDLDNYKAVFADRPYPMGDAAPYGAPRHPAFAPLRRAADDPPGAASRFFVDVAGTRVLFVDNSCWYIRACEPYLARADGDRREQFDWLRARASEARDKGMASLVVMHMPTRDPRDQADSKELRQNHVMGKGSTTDNAEFERVAAESGVDAVMTGHIKGQFLYRGEGGVPYFIDGGAGGELYTEGPVGTDHGYWHGIRLLRVAGGRITSTDTVPIVADDGLRIEGARTVERGERTTFQGFVKQPVVVNEAKVDALELRDPDPVPKLVAAGLGAAGPAAAGLLALLLLAGRPRGRRSVVLAAGVVVLAGAGAAATAQQARPTATPKDALPEPARIWTSANPRVLAPVASGTDDPRRDPATQTEDGRFEGRCPGTTTLSLTTGFETEGHAVTVPSAEGPIAAGFRRGARAARRGRRAAAGTIALAQPAVVRARVRFPAGPGRAKRRVAVLEHRCVDAAGTVPVTWRVPRGARRGVYEVELAVLSDRAPVIRRFGLRVR